MEYLAAFTIGLFGSLHCMGMCGPIAMALPLTTKEKSLVAFQSLLYNLGRISTYAILGLFMGLMGWGIVLAGYQKSFSILLGLILIITAIFSVSIEQKMFTNRYFQQGFNFVKIKLAKSLSINSNSNAYQIGLLNGILPCGLVYVALAGAVAVGNSISGALYMAAFGLGTLPLMFGAMIFSNFYKKSFVNFRRWIPVGLILIGVLFIYRGVMLDVPLDLKFWEANNFPIFCH